MLTPEGTGAGSSPPPAFPLVGRYMGLRMGVDFAALTAGRAEVVESPRRLRRELSYGFVPYATSLILSAPPRDLQAGG